MRHAVTGLEILPRCTRSDCTNWQVCRLKYEINYCTNKREVKKLDIRLNKLSAKNFKGVKQFILEINGKNASIFADNAVGKTTLFDAFKWILFGKDSSNRSKFKIKPQDENGNEVHHLQTEGEVELLVDGKVLKLRKMLEEKWTAKKGNTEKEHTGNTIFYWWDDEPVLENEYIKRISGLVNEDIFMAVTDPRYFNQLDWKKRKTILLSMCGDVDESEILANEKFAKLLDILSGKSVEVYKKILAEKIALLEKQRKDIPARIDELTQTMPEAAEDYTAVEVEIEQLKASLVKIDKEIVSANNNAIDYRKKQQQVFKMKNDLQDLKIKLDAEANSGVKGIIDEKSKLENEQYRLETEITTSTSRLGNGDIAIATKNTQKATLLTTYTSLKTELADTKAVCFVEPEEGGFTCPTCGQGLPEESRESKLNDMKHRFETVKNAEIKIAEGKISENVNSGRQLKADIEAAQKLMAEITATHNMQKIKLKDVQAKIIAIVIPEGNIVADYNSNVEYCALQDVILALETELDKPIEDLTTDLLRSKRETQNKIDNCNSVIGSKEVAEKSKKRIDELKTEEKRLANEITIFKGQEYLVNEFGKAKINSLEDKINNQFKFVKFKMSEDYIDPKGSNESKEMCEAMVNTNGKEVPYSTNANTAGAINAGLDCINALSNFYKVTAPVWVDNCESVSECIETNSQLISLVKPETFVKLDKILQDALIEKYKTFDDAKRFWNDRNKKLRVEVNL